MCRKLRQKPCIVSQRAKHRTLRGCDGRPQDNTSNFSRPGEWIEMNSSALSPTLLWPCPERRWVAMDCPYLEIEGQSCLVDNVINQGLMKIDKSTYYWTDNSMMMTKKRARKKKQACFPKATLPGIYQQITPPKKFWDFLAKLAAFH